MAESITPDPHDRFFKETFGRTEHAVPFLRGVVPSGLSGQIDWASLQREEASFLDETLAKRSSDLLFSVTWNGSGAYVYCLFEHQSSSDPSMPLRLLRYLVRIWDRWERENPAGGKLPLIIPVVLFQGRGGWKASPDLRGLMMAPPEGSEEWTAFVPVFSYLVLDVQETGVLDRFRDWRARHILALLASVLQEKDELRLRDAFAALEQLVRVQGDDLTYLRTALTYLFMTSGDIDKNDFQTQIERIGEIRLKDETMSIAELLRTEGWQQGREEGWQQGRQEGRQEGRMVGTIQELQGILGLAVDSTASLTQRSEGELVVQLDLLKAEVRQRLR